MRRQGVAHNRFLNILEEAYQMKTLLLGGAAAVAIFAGGAAIAQIAPAGPAVRNAHAHVAKTQTRAEVQAHVQRMFARLDANKDGFVTSAEASAVRAQFAGRMQHRAAEHRANGDRSKAFERLDANRDGMISRAEFAAPRPHRMAMQHAGMRRGFGGRMFEMADANRDGRVSMAEAQQLALQHFNRADLNRDGVLTPQERQQSRQQMRGQRHAG
jgi:Ca2+-binding EF-hand superfamily protein